MALTSSKGIFELNVLQCANNTAKVKMRLNNSCRYSRCLLSMGNLE